MTEIELIQTPATTAPVPSTTAPVPSTTAPVPATTAPVPAQASTSDNAGIFDKFRNWRNSRAQAQTPDNAGIIDYWRNKWRNSRTPAPAPAPAPAPTPPPGEQKPADTSSSWRQNMASRWNGQTSKQKRIVIIIIFIVICAAIMGICYFLSKLCSGPESTQGVLCKLANAVADAISDVALYPYLFIGVLVLGLFMRFFSSIRDALKKKVTNEKSPAEKATEEADRLKDPSVKDLLELNGVRVANAAPTAAEVLAKGIENLATGKSFGTDNRIDPAGDNTGGGKEPGPDPDRPDRPDHPVV